MAQVIGKRKRGRTLGELRVAASALALSLTPSGANASVKTSVIAPDGSEESVTLSVPKGDVVIPFALTAGKNDENSREQIRNGAKDAGVEVTISSLVIKFDQDGSEAPLFLMALKDGAKAPTTAPAKPSPRKRK